VHHSGGSVAGQVRGRGHAARGTKHPGRWFRVGRRQAAAPASGYELGRYIPPSVELRARPLAR
ncbi:hypothetical protein FE68_15790, partial [Staphylococcus aureus]